MKVRGCLMVEFYFFVLFIRFYFVGLLSYKLEVVLKFFKCWDVRSMLLFLILIVCILEF